MSLKRVASEVDKSAGEEIILIESNRKIKLILEIMTILF